jgi:hypothetical protein
VNIRNIIADGLIMALSVALLWHLSNIWRYGQHLVEEPNIVIRSLETAGLLGIFIFGATKCISDMKRYEGKIGNRTKEMLGR